CAKSPRAGRAFSEPLKHRRLQPPTWLPFVVFEEQWKRSSTTSTRISWTAASTCLPTNLGKTDISFSENQHAIKSIKSTTTHGSDTGKPGRFKSLPSVLIKTLARPFMRHLSECRLPASLKLARLCCVGSEISTMQLCLTFIDLKKTFYTVNTEAVIEALGYEGVPA
ncbi:hypothetical protein V3C99_001783, partial [Haemonchus contortus]